MSRLRQKGRAPNLKNQALERADTKQKPTGPARFALRPCRGAAVRHQNRELLFILRNFLPIFATI
jgi:hypothetical protein